MLSAVTTSLLVCVVKLFIWYVAVCCLCVCACLMYLSVGCLVVNSSSQPNIPSESRNRRIQTELIINLEVAELTGYDVFSSETTNA